LSKENFRSGSVYALFALLCFHSARLESKINAAHEIVDLEHQDRSQWYQPLIVLGNDALRQARHYPDRSAYHFEAAIAAEHVRAIRFEQTDWDRILALYEQLYELQAADSTLLSMATVHLQLDQLEAAKALLDQISQNSLARRNYLLQGCYAAYYLKSGNEKKAIEEIEKAISSCSNRLERAYLEKKKTGMLARFNE
jgi:RNA polymerase sigma-70 factor (ECF subfamily)